jgi:[acyl-carrier-protein] S-malonyltransferase
MFGRDPFLDELVDHASLAVGEDVARTCARGPSRKLARTRFLQPAMTAVCLGLWKKIVDAGVEPLITAGHSVGEIPALAACGAIDPRDAVSLAAVRGEAMDEAAKLQEGTMIAVTGLGVEEVFKIVEPFAETGVVAAAAVNAPGQVAISGDPAILDRVTQAIRREQDVRVTPLRVSGAWHCEHMRPAVTRFTEALNDLALSVPSVKMVFNRHGRESADPDDIKNLISGQLVTPVRWDLVMDHLAQAEITDFVEIGPGKVLRGLIRLNLPDPDVRVHNVSDLRSLDRLVTALDEN